MLAQPCHTAVLGAGMTRGFMHRLLLPDIPYPQLLVSRGGGEKRAVGTPRQTLHDVRVLERDLRLPTRDIPELDGEIPRGRGQDVLGCGIEQDLANFPA